MSLDSELPSTRRDTWSGPEKVYTSERPHFKDSHTEPPFWSQERLPIVTENEIPSSRYLDSPEGFNTSADDAIDRADPWNKKVVLSLGKYLKASKLISGR